MSNYSNYNTNSSDDVILTDFIIVFTSVQCNKSGNYTLTVSNEAELATTSFIFV